MASTFVILCIKDRALRPERVFRDRTQNLDTMTDRELIARYRFPRQSILSLTDMVADVIEQPTEDHMRYQQNTLKNYIDLHMYQIYPLYLRF